MRGSPARRHPRDRDSVVPRRPHRSGGHRPDPDRRAQPAGSRLADPLELRASASRTRRGNLPLQSPPKRAETVNLSSNGRTVPRPRRADPRRRRRTAPACSRPRSRSTRSGVPRARLPIDAHHRRRDLRRRRVPALAVGGRPRAPAAAAHGRRRRRGHPRRTRTPTRLQRTSRRARLARRLGERRCSTASRMAPPSSAASSPMRATSCARRSRSCAATSSCSRPETTCPPTPRNPLDMIASESGRMTRLLDELLVLARLQGAPPPASSRSTRRRSSPRSRPALGCSDTARSSCRPAPTDRTRGSRVTPISSSRRCSTSCETRSHTPTTAARIEIACSRQAGRRGVHRHRRRPRNRRGGPRAHLRPLLPLPRRARRRRPAEQVWASPSRKRSLSCTEDGSSPSNVEPHGARFTIELPRDRAARGRAQSAEARPPRHGQRPTQCLRTTDESERSTR